MEDLIIQLKETNFMEKSLCINEVKEVEMIHILKNDFNPNKICIDIKNATILKSYKEGIKSIQIEFALTQIQSYLILTGEIKLVQEN
ncbi:hypothetical protein [Prochlorococcus marinus]|uniref:hypothetical protein n=1 Tax=Prochlorococcus marinus TaxID=1219 RepID=UPI0022B55607|nr:hypothetical protein [Prochlorococcus marinus]